MTLRFLARLAAALLVAAAATTAQSATVLWYQSMPGDWVGEGQTHTYQAPADTFEVVQANPSVISVRVNYPGEGNMTIDLAAYPGQSLAAGAHEMAARFGLQGRSPGLSIAKDDRYCSTSTGRFTILEVVFDAGGQLVSFAANLEQRCEQDPPLYAELRLNSSVPLTADEPAGSTSPDAFAFLPRTVVAPSVVVTSNPVTIYGINSPAEISIAGGEYSVNGGPFVGTAGSVNNRDRILVRLLSAPTTNTLSTATLTVDGSSAAFNVTTYSPGTPISAIFLDSTPGEPIQMGEAYFGVAPDWAIQPLFVSAGRVSFQLYGPGGLNYSLDLASNPPTGLRLGPFEETARWPFNGSSPGLDFEGNGRACNESTGRFVVLDLDLNSNHTVVNRFAANFEQQCADGGPLYGEIRYNSATPLTFMSPSGDTLPDAFALQAQTPVKAGAVVTSNSITVYGINTPVPISVTGGTYSVNGGPFTSAAGTVHELDHVVVRMTASSVPGALNHATLTVGDLPEVPFDVTTYQEGMALTGVYFRSTSPNGPFGNGQPFLYLSPRNNFAATAPQGLNSVHVAMSGTAGISFDFDAGAPGSSPLTVGSYADVLDYPVRGSSYGIHFGGQSLYCDVGPEARLVVREISIVGGVVQRFAADWVYSCRLSEGSIFGEIRVNSTVPFRALTEAAPPPLVVRRPRDMNGDGTSDVVIRDSTNGTAYGWIMNGLAVASGGYLLAADSGWSVVQMADFNGDDRADILIQHTDGSVYMWLMDGLSVIGGGYLLGAGTGWSVSHVGDLDGDGKADVLLAHADGSIYIQTMNGATATGGTFLQGAGSGWSVTHVADLNGDGKADILAKHVDGSIYAYLMNGAAIQGGTYLIGAGSGWSATATGDFNGDGRQDILITHTNGGVYLWQMDGLAIETGTYLLSPGSGWSIDRTADLDGDGRSDIIIKHTDGSYYAWMMQGLSVAYGNYLLGPGTGWSVSHALYLDNDGRSDILIRHTDGSIYGWLMDGPNVTNGTYLMGAGPWRVTP